MTPENPIGLFIAQGGRTLDDPLAFDSTRPRLQSDLQNPRPLIDVVDIPSGIPNPILEGQSRVEDLFVLPHGLGYKPLLFITLLFYRKGSSPEEGSYSNGFFVFAGNGLIEETVKYDITSTALRIRHIMSINTGIPGFSWDPILNLYNCRVKYIICNFPARNTLRDMSDTNISFRGDGLD
jgi:hypothetical protein